MSDFMPAGPEKGTFMRPTPPESRILDSEILLRKVFDEDPRQGCAMLFRLHYAELFSHAIRFVYSRHVAEDIVGEIFYKFWEERTFERITSSYRGYLFKSVRHRAYNYVKFELAKRSRNENFDSGRASKPDEILQYDELYHLLEESINKLPSQCRKVFVMSRMENKRYLEIATELGISVKAVEAHITRALRILRKQLTHTYDWI